VTLETVNDRVVPVPDKVPLVAEPVPEVIVISVAINPVGTFKNPKLIAVVVGLPVGFAVQVILGAGATSVTFREVVSTPAKLIDTDTVPALTLETVNERVFPVPDNVPLVANPVPEEILMFAAARFPGLALKVKLMAVVVGLPEADADHVILAAAARTVTD